MSDKKTAILKAAKSLNENYASEELFMPKSGRRLPNRSVIIDIVRDLKSIVFPGYFSTDTSASMFPEYYAGHRLNDIYDRKNFYLYFIIQKALSSLDNCIFYMYNCNSDENTI